MSVDENGLEETQNGNQNASAANTPPEEVTSPEMSAADGQADVNYEESSEDKDTMSTETLQTFEEQKNTPVIVEDMPADDPPSESENAPVAENPDEGVTQPALTEAAQAEPAAAAETRVTKRIPSGAKEAGINRGDVIEGMITGTTPTQITVDLRDGVKGIITGRELERMTRKSLEDLREGEQITVFVVNPNDHQGNVILSVNRALEELDWQTAEQYRQEQTIYEDKIAGYNKGGLIVRFGRLRGFVPQSQIGDDRRRGMVEGTPQEMYGRMVNDDIVVRVMEVDRARNRLILSERAATRERRERRKAALIEELAVGQVMEGRVVSLEDFGAFVDVGGAEGLVHLTEISWSHVNHPKEVLDIGQIVRVEVISVDRKRKRIGLSVKRQAADPWDEIATTYQVGDLVQGTITKLTKFGAFAQLVDAAEIEGLVHISELSDQRVTHPREVVEEGEKLTLRVVKIDVKNRRLGLSLKKVNSAEYLDRDLASATYMQGSTDGAVDDDDDTEEQDIMDVPVDLVESDNGYEDERDEDTGYDDSGYDDDDVPSASDDDDDDDLADDDDED